MSDLLFAKAAERYAHMCAELDRQIVKTCRQLSALTNACRSGAAVSPTELQRRLERIRAEFDSKAAALTPDHIPR